MSRFVRMIKLALETEEKGKNWYETQKNYAGATKSFRRMFYDARVSPNLKDLDLNCSYIATIDFPAFF